MCDITLLVPAEIWSGPVDTIHFAGGNVSLNCFVSGLPQPEILWYKDGQGILGDERVTILDTTNIQSTLNLAYLMMSDDGNYYCEARNQGAHGIDFVVSSEPAHLSIQCEHPLIDM